MRPVLLTYWLVYPALLLLVSLGCGLLVDAVARGRVGGWLLLPTGFAAATVLATAVTWQAWSAPAVGPALLAVAIAGLVVGGRGAWARLRGNAADVTGGAVLGLLAFLAFGASVIATGSPSFTGYTQIVDISHQMDYAAWLTEFGRSIPAVVDSSWREQAFKLTDVGYPSGVQATWGGLADVTGLEIAWSYQPFVAFAAAMLALVVAGLLRGFTAAPRPVVLLAAFVAAQPSLLIGYGQMGGIKEVAAAAFVLLTAALLPLRAEDLTLRSTVPAIVAMSAAFAVLSITVLPWIGTLSCVWLVGYAWRRSHKRDVVKLGAAGLLVFVGLSLSTLAAALRSASAVAVVESEELGNLAAPVDRIAAAGIWLTGDHRYPLADYAAASVALSVVALLLAAGGVLLVARRGHLPGIALAVAGITAFAVMVWRVGPWVELKTFVLSGPIVLVFAMTAVLWLLSRSRLSRIAGVLALLAVGGGVAAGDVLRYRQATVAPFDRFHELDGIGERFAGADGALLTDFEEHGEFQLRTVRGVSNVNPARGRFGIRPEVASTITGLRFTWDVDELDPAFVQEFELVVMPLGSGASTPPANYRRVLRGDHYEVWRRGPGAIGTHAPLSGVVAPQDRRACARVLAGTGGGARLALQRRSAAAALDPRSLTPNWAAATAAVGSTTVKGPGNGVARIRVERSGTYEVYVETSTIRPLAVAVDGNPLGSVSGLSYYPRRLRAGSLALSAGAHRVELTRGGGDLSPGNDDGGGRPVGIVALVPEGHPRTVLAGDEARRGCARGPLDWAGVVRRP